MKRKSRILCTAVTGIVALSLSTAAGDYTLDWWTVDGGGIMWSPGGVFELSGTIGQPDAGVLTGGIFELVGGFWAAPPCWCMADVNHDSLRDGRDIQGFIDCLLAAGANCACADVSTDGVLDLADLAAFVDDLLAGGECP